MEGIKNKRYLYDKMTPETIRVLCAVYHVDYTTISAEIGITRRTFYDRQETGRWKDTEKEKIISIFQQRGLELSEIVLYHAIAEYKSNTFRGGF